MLNFSGRKRRIGFKGDARTAYARQGWEDARMQRPFNYELIDRADRYCAGAYETMRLRVMALRAAGREIPRWLTDHSVPSRVAGLVNEAALLNQTSRADGQGYWPVGQTGWQPAAG